VPADPTSRFSDRVDDYVAARPGYPDGVIAFLAEHGGLRPGARVADIGCGTGIFTRQLCVAGARVVGVEPNDAMRAAAATLQDEFPELRLVAGRAEATGLDGHCVDLVVAAQAFHWFEPEPTRAEWARILVPGGAVGLIWNDRLIETSAFLRGLEDLLLRHGTDYETVSHRGTADAGLDAFFSDGYSATSLPNGQLLDWTGLRQRVMSASYVPPVTDPRHAAMLGDLGDLFEREKREGRVRIDYATHVYCGRIGATSPVRDPS
jgi:SAM-dependent methyltransferase